MHGLRPEVMRSLGMKTVLVESERRALRDVGDMRGQSTAVRPSGAVFREGHLLAAIDLCTWHGASAIPGP